MAGDFTPHYRAAGARYNVDPLLLRAIAQAESSENPNVADSSAGAQGPMQIIPDTQRRLGMKPGAAKDYSLAVHAGADLLDQNLKRYGDVDKAVLAYHGGTDERNWGPKTRAYLQKVTSNYQALKGPKDDPNDAFSAAIKAAPKAAGPDDNDAFSASLAVPKAGPTPPAPVADQPVSGAPGAPSGGPRFESRMDNLVRDEFKAPLGPSDQFLDAIGLNAAGPSGIIRAPVRGLLTAGDAVMRGGNVLLKGAAGAAGDVANIATHLVPGISKGDPATTGAQVARDVMGMAIQAGMSPVGIPAPSAARAVPETANRMIERGPVMAPVAEVSGNRLIPQAPAEVIPPGAGARPGQTVEPVAAGPVPPAPGPIPLPGRAAAEAAAPAAEMTTPTDLAPRRTPVLTKAQADREANRILVHYAGDGPAVVDLTSGLTGENRTLAQATGNAGLAALERSAMDVNPNAFTARAAARGEARTNAYQQAIGTGADVEALEAMRDASTARARGKAFEETSPVDPTPVAKAITEALESPAGQRDAVKASLTGVLNKLVQTDPVTGAQKLQTDPAQLYGIRQAISDSISPKAAGTAGDARLAARELIDVQRALDTVIEQGAPGYNAYMKSYAEQSRPIEAMQFLQGLNLTNAKGEITLAKVDAALKGIEKQRGLPGARAAKSISDDQIATLDALRHDLRIEDRSSLGKGIGSNTVQKLMTSGTLAHHLFGSHGGRAMSGAMGLEALFHSPTVAATMAGAQIGLSHLSAKGNKLVYESLMEKLLDPAKGAEALKKP